MNILLFDPHAFLVDFSMRAAAQGHEVRHWMMDRLGGSPNRIGQGLVNRVRGWQSHLKWADLIVLGENTLLLPTFDALRSKGYPVFGPSAEGANWELDRSVGQALLAAAGVKTAESIPFDSYVKAAGFVQRGARRYVAKPNGDKDRSLSYVSKGAQDMCYMLDLWQRTRPAGKPDFVLQEFIPGVEFAVGGFFGPGGWCGPFLENFEHKKFMAGDVGQATGEMGTALRYVRQSKLAEQVLRPLEPYLYRSNYRGYIDVSVIVDKQGRAWPLEFTCRFGLPLWLIQQALHPDVAGWMLDLVQGRNTFKPCEDVAIGVVLALPDFPYNKKPKEQVDGVPIFGFEDIGEDAHPDELRIGQALGNEQIVSAGQQIMTVTGRAATASAAREKAYRNIRKLNIPQSPMYRIDIAGEKLKQNIAWLQERGYATDWEY
jgi:phosphoribosylamine--glycine ligase